LTRSGGESRIIVEPAMTTWPFAVELGIAVALVLLVVASTVRFLLVSGRQGLEPMIKARFKQLQPGWYQLDVRAANRAPYGFRPFRSTGCGRARPG
jgi:hypothetical protein